MQDGVPAATTERALLAVENARKQVINFLENEGEPNPFKFNMIRQYELRFYEGKEKCGNDDQRNILH